MTSDKSNLRPETLAAQALGWVDGATRAIVLPLHPATTYERDADNEYRSGRSYSRADNPTYDQAEALLTALEDGADAMLFASGMAAATAVFQSLRPGDHAVVPRVIYHGLRKWLLGPGTAGGLDIDLLDEVSAETVSAAIRPGRTRLVWIETPANPMWHVTDIRAVADAAHAAGDVVVAVDSTAATPVLTRPLALGADLVMHSATKYLNGHSDTVAGALVTARQDQFWEELAMRRRGGGAVLGPFEAWLLLRGMRTLYLRVRASSDSALALARHLAAHPKVAAVHYPGLPDHPDHDVARRQMQGGFGGMLSVRIAGGEAAAITVAARLKVFKRATSLGGVESLAEHRASVEGEGTPVPPDLLRLSIGVEAAEDLIADFDQALEAV